MAARLSVLLTPYLLLHGPEPDNRWEAFAAAVRAVVEQLRRAAAWSAWARCRWRCRTPGRSRSPTTPTTPSCCRRESPWRGELRIPSSAQALLELRLGEWGHDAMGFVAHIPHYLAQLDYPQASAALLEHVERVGRAAVDLDRPRGGGARRDEARSRRTSRTTPRCARSCRRSSSSTTRSQRAEQEGSSLLAEDEPTCRPARRSAPQFEQFLAGLDAPDEDERLMPCPLRRRSSSSSSTSRPSTSTSSAARSPTPTAAARLRRPGRRPGAGRRRSAPSTPALDVHSLHSYFLRPGDTSVPIVYDVERIRDGRSFATRRVVARQHGRPIFYLTANFQVPEEGFDHQDVMPDVPGAGGRPDLRRARALRPATTEARRRSWRKEWAALDARYLGNSGPGQTDSPRTSTPARARLWIRVNGDARRRPDAAHRRRSPTPAT